MVDLRLLYISSYGSVKLEIQKMLTDNYGISVDAILNNERYIERISCPLIENWFDIHTKFVNLCHGRLHEKQVAQVPMVKHQATFSQTLDLFLQERELLIEGLQSGQGKYCSSCPLVKKIPCSEKHLITWIGIGSDAHTSCNFKCTYCFVAKSKSNPLEFNEDFFSEVIGELESRSLISPEITQITFAHGEFGISPLKKTFFESTKDYYIQIISNASIFEPLLAEKFLAHKAKLITSIDCGTRETFKLIKSVDCYDKVCDNLIQYAKCGANIVMKYIILPTPGLNDNSENLLGFIGLCNKLRELGASILVRLATDMTYKGDYAIYLKPLYTFIDLLKQENFAIDLHSLSVFSDSEKENLYSVINNEERETQ
jgi:hypothetical protein